MREISTQAIIDAVKDSAIKANFELGDDVVRAFKDGIEKEDSPVGKDILNQLIEELAYYRQFLPGVLGAWYGKEAPISLIRTCPCSSNKTQPTARG